MEYSQHLGIIAFFTQADGIGKSVVFILFAMSLVTWYLIVTKALQVVSVRKRSARFLEMFWNSPSLEAVASQLAEQSRQDPFSHLAHHALKAVEHHARHGVDRLNEAGSSAEFLTRAMRRVIDEETARIEAGQTLLASVGSTAPFVGLFGTVWGVYHALVNIGMSGQGSLDKVAGPVGEALIMTALGLAVAIPAVLAYNTFNRGNRLLLAQLDAYAHDLFAFLSTGVHVNAATTTPGGK